MELVNAKMLNSALELFFFVAWMFICLKIGFEICFGKGVLAPMSSSVIAGLSVSTIGSIFVELGG